MSASLKWRQPNGLRFWPCTIHFGTLLSKNFRNFPWMVHNMHRSKGLRTFFSPFLSHTCSLDMTSTKRPSFLTVHDELWDAFSKIAHHVSLVVHYMHRSKGLQTFFSPFLSDACSLDITSTKRASFLTVHDKRVGTLLSNIARHVSWMVHYMHRSNELQTFFSPCLSHICILEMTSAKRAPFLTVLDKLWDALE